MGNSEDTVCFLAEQKWFKDKYKDPAVLPKLSKDDMAGTMKVINNLRSCHCVIKMPCV